MTVAPITLKDIKICRKPARGRDERGRKGILLKFLESVDFQELFLSSSRYGRWLSRFAEVFRKERDFLNFLGCSSYGSRAWFKK